MKASNSITITEINDGLGVSSVIVEYYRSTSATELIGGTWSEDVPEKLNGTFLWSKTTYIMSDGTEIPSEAACISGYDGAIGHDGVGITSITDYYQVSSSNEVAPSSWVTDPSQVEMTDINRYLWNYTVITYDDESEQVTDAKVIGVRGEDGENGENGENAEVYEIALSSSVIKVSDTGVISPSSIRCSFFKKEGSSDRTQYSGRYRIVGYGSSGTVISTSTASSDVTYVDITPSSDVSYYQITLFKAGGTSVTLDSQTLPILVDPAAYTVLLDNESHTFAGTETSATQDSVVVTVLAYRGRTQVTPTIGTIDSSALPTGLTASVNTANSTVTFSTTTSMTTASGTVTIPITVDGISFDKEFSYSIAFKGVNGSSPTIHMLMVSSDVIKVSDTGIVSPSSIALTSVSKTGDGASSDSYAGRFVVVGYSSNGTSTTIYTSDNDESSASFNPSTSYSYYISTLYASGGTTTVLDTQSIPVLKDEVAYTVFLNNEAHTFAGTATAAVGETVDVTVFTYKGRNLVTPSNITITSQLPRGMSATISGRLIRFNVTSDMSTASGTVTIAVTIDNNVFNKTFSYSIAFAGNTGQNGVSVTSMVQHYAVSTTNSPDSPPETWVDDPSQVTMTTTDKYLWSYTTINYSSGNPTNTNPVVIGVYGNTGTAARIYMLLLSVDAVKVAKDGTITPGTITANSYHKNGTSTTKTAYSGRFQVVGYKSDNTTKTVYTSSGNESSCSFTPSSNYVSYTVTLYANGATTNPLDSQTVPVITDGSDGSSASAYTVYLTNESHTFAGNPTSAIAGSTTTGVVAYKDTTQLPVTINSVTGTIANQLEATIQNNGETNAAVQITATSALTTRSGVLSINLTADGQNFTKQFSWSVALAGTDGRGVVSVTPQYYLSTSDTEPVGGAWSTTQPTWQQGYYIWTRTEIVYTDSATPVYTSPYCDDSLNQVITYVDENDKDLQDQISEQASVIVDSETRITAIEEQNSSFEQTLDSIRSDVTTIGTDINGIQTTISTQIQQTSDEITLLKETTNENSKLREYITVDGSKMTFGSSDSDVTLELDNDKLAFKSGDTEVAYMSDQRMFITDATVDNELQIGGKWALYIRSNDHLTLKWIG